MTIKKARKALGDRGKKMTDEEIMKVEEHLRMLVNKIIDRVLEDRKDGIMKHKKPRG